MKRFLFLLLLLVPLIAFAQPSSNLGFLNQNIWISPTPFFSGEDVRIYTVVFNGSDSDATGTVVFNDGDKKIGESEFSLAGGGRLSDVWVDWSATEGDHLFSAKIVGVKVSGRDGSNTVLDLEDQQSTILRLSVDRDTDGDGVGDREDADDDNDGLTDKREAELKTDPKKADTDGDGLVDGQDESPLTYNLPTTVSSFPIKSPAIETSNDDTIVKKTSANILKALEDFRRTQADGLIQTKNNLKIVIEDDRQNVSLKKQKAADKRNISINQLNEALNDDFFRKSEEADGLPNFTFSRLLNMTYLGVVNLGLFIFENKWIFYLVLVLILTKFLFIIFKRFFRRY